MRRTEYLEIVHPPIALGARPNLAQEIPFCLDDKASGFKPLSFWAIRKVACPEIPFKGLIKSGKRFARARAAADGRVFGLIVIGENDLAFFKGKRRAVR